MAAYAGDPVPHRQRYGAAWPPVAARWLFGLGRRPVPPVWFPDRPPPERALPYVPAPDDQPPRSHAPARPQSGVPIRARAPTDARARPDSILERCSPARPWRSDTPEPLPEKMFQEA